MMILAPPESRINHRKAPLIHLQRLNRHQRIAFWILLSDTIVNTQFPTTQAI